MTLNCHVWFGGQPLEARQGSIWICGRGGRIGLGLRPSLRRSLGRGAHLWVPEQALCISGCRPPGPAQQSDPSAASLH